MTEEVIETGPGVNNHSAVEPIGDVERKWEPKEEKYKTGVLNIYAKHAQSPIKGGYME